MTSRPAFGRDGDQSDSCRNTRMHGVVACGCRLVLQQPGASGRFQAQRFVSVHATVSNPVKLGRDLAIPDEERMSLAGP
jgi:hypothetical protein